jgi:hypothetical protein
MGKNHPRLGNPGMPNHPNNSARYYNFANAGYNIRKESTNTVLEKID